MKLFTTFPASLQPSIDLVQRCVVVARQADGYGLTVTGDHPVYVHTVKLDGAAYRAGVRQGDKIIKVNGMPVTASNHLEVVRMISGGSVKPSDEIKLTSYREILLVYISFSFYISFLKGLRESSMEGTQLERALQRIESLQNQLRNIESLSLVILKFEIFYYLFWLQFDSHGPFSNFKELLNRPAHLATFINYLLENANPSSLFFYLITNAYQNSSGTSKELRKWAYEIFSTFLIPNAPLWWDSIEQSLVQNIDKVFVLTATTQGAESDMEPLLRIFLSARQKSLEDIAEHLANFRQKRKIGLGSLFDANQLARISKGDSAMEMRVGEAILIRSLETLLSSVNYDLDNCDSRSLALISSLATVIKVVLNMRSNTNEKILDRCPTFVTRDKSAMFKMKMSTKRSVQIKGHHFILTHINLTVYCYQCREAIWGVNAQAFFCQNCDVVVHKQCTSSLVDYCYPAAQKKAGMSKSKQRSTSGGKYENRMDKKGNVKSVSSDSGIGADFEKPVSRSHSMRTRVVETEVPSLESILGWEVVRHLKPKEKKRQEVINELFHTERTHVRNLKILFKVFYKPMLMQKVVPPDIVKLFFANIDEVLEIHSEMNKKMRLTIEAWRKDNILSGLFGEIGPLMESLFDGENGQKLMQTTSVFCQHQQHALDILRQRSKKEKDDQLGRFLAEAESNPLCRKLQLKDMLPVEMQRLVKYPLLLETIAKYTIEPSEEQTRLLNSVNSAKRILSAVNTAKRNAENLRRLDELQKRLIIPAYDRELMNADLSSLNLTNYKLVHDGSLTWRFSRGKMVELHAVLLEGVLLLLTKAGDGQKLLLKIQEPSKDSRWFPVLPLLSLIIKEKANDKRAFFIVNNIERGAQIYELVASTATERKTWFKLIADQIDFAKQNDQVQLLTHPRLVNANEIIVEQPTVLEHARPILTASERLKRTDQIILRALLEKRAILTEFLPGVDKGDLKSLEELTEKLTGLAVGELKQKDGRELAVSAIVHGNRLLDAINQADKTDSDLPSVPCYKLTVIAAPLMNHLKAMLQIIEEQHNEIVSLKQQLNQYKDLAENGPGYRTMSEETLTESNPNVEKISSSVIDTEMERRKKLLNKRQRNAALSISSDTMQHIRPASK
ncbi:unnamed protein product [Dracunculus medinensis]|uniref:Rho guanine nucleotide exchange factor 12 n=1 Tax=Dracunculus medinensis TaxID=318479 RepID=A0A3P7T6K0_DRAME|nr:unnamed protein product [Dracunculus medinensis]